MNDVPFYIVDDVRASRNSPPVWVVYKTFPDVSARLMMAGYADLDVATDVRDFLNEAAGDEV